MYTQKVHNETIPSFIAKETTVKYAPLERDFTAENTVKLATLNSRIIGVSNEAVSAGEMVGVDNRRYVLGLVGTGGVSAGANLKADGAGGFITAGTAGDVIVAIAQQTGAEDAYIEIELLNQIRLVPAA